MSYHRIYNGKLHKPLSCRLSGRNVLMKFPDTLMTMDVCFHDIFCFLLISISGGNCSQEKPTPFYIKKTARARICNSITQHMSGFWFLKLSQLPAHSTQPLIRLGV